MTERRSVSQTSDRYFTNAGPTAVRLQMASALVGALILSGCASATPPPRFSAVSPADSTAPEAATPVPTPVLTGSGELAEPPAPAPSPESMGGHEGHSMPGMDMPMPDTMASPAPSHPGHAAPVPGTESETYTCRMHPQVRAKAPGSCPICGMTLVKKPGEPKERHP